MANTSFLCELAWLGGPSANSNVLIDVIDGRISAITTGVTTHPDATLLPGLTLPGFANAHSHAFHRALRSRTHFGQGSFWSWRDQMYNVAVRLNPDSYFDLARATYGEMVCAGITSVGEFHYLHHGQDGVPYQDPNAMADALIAAAHEAGIRLTLLDTCYLQGAIGVEPNETQRRFSDGDVSSWMDRVERLRSASSSQDTCIGAAIHSVRAVDRESMTSVAAWARAANAPLHAHVSEQPAENEQCIAAYGATPMQVLADSGALSERFTAVHATHLAQSDVDVLSSHRCTVCMCPTTERDLADGIGSTQEFRRSGVPLSLGSDSHALIDLFEEARAVEMNERLRSLQRGTHQAQELLTAATATGHASLGWPDTGKIEVAMSADLVSVRLDSLRTAGTDAACAIEAAVFAASATDVHHVVVGGRVVVRDHHHVSFDVSRALATSIESLWTQ